MRFNTKNITVRISFLFLAVVFIVLVYQKNILPLVIFISALLHEAGHLFCLFICRTKIKAVYFNLFGMKIVRGVNPRINYRDECRIAIMGPLVNLTIFLLFLTLFFCIKSAILLEIAILNLFLALFNLLPVYSLDGGNALYSLLALRRSAMYANKALTVISFIVVIPLILIGAYLLLKSKYNFTVLVAGVYLIVLLIFKKSKLSPC